MEGHARGPGAAEAVPDVHQLRRARSEHRVRRAARPAPAGHVRGEAATMSLATLTSARAPAVSTAEWIDVCRYDDLAPGTGAAALIAGEQIAVIRTRGGAVYAISNFDPFSKAFVLARGIVGDRGGIPRLASPIYKQGFDLRTGACFDDPNVRVPVYPVKIARGRILVGCAGSPP